MARPARRPGNLPAEAASFVGRRRELAEVRKKLAETRLVSLVGPGGVGKTRLAIRAAGDLARGFRDGGWLVELAEVEDPALVSHAVMAALDLRDQAAAGPQALLRDHLRDSELLLVVDNCEHLASAAGRLVADLMRAAPGLRVIATSREPLSVPGEYVVPVPPLALPAPGAAEPLAQLRQNEAVSLFTECASADVPAAEALDVLSSLVAKSLVTKEETRGLACYRLHETMREFARLKLAEAGEEEATELRCAGYYRARCAQSALEGRYRLLDWLAWADLEIDNIRAVLRRCLNRGDAAAGLHLAASLGWYWITRATTEGIRWLDEFLAAKDTADADPQVLGWAQFMRGFLAVLKADPAAAGPPLHAAVAVARPTGQRELLSEALSMAAVTANMAGDRAEARRLLGEADAAVASLGQAYPSGLIAVLQARALDGFFAADPGAVRAAAGRAAALARETGDLYALEIMLLNLGSAALLDGDPGEARPLLTEALRIARQIDDRVAQFYLLAAPGCHAAEVGQPRLAARLIAAADAERTGAGANVMPFLAPALSRATESAAAALGPAGFAAESEAGRHLDRDTALNLALGQPVAGQA